MNIWEVHPSLVHFPIAFLLGAVALDLFAWWRSDDGLARAATWLIIAGVAMGLLAANFGLLAFYTVPAHTHEAHRLMYWHLGLAVATLVLFGWVAVARWFRRGMHPTTASRIIGAIGAVLLTVTGYLGGHIVYRGGAGVDPDLLALDVREAHEHGDVASRDHQPAQGDQVERSYYAPKPKADHQNHKHHEAADDEGDAKADQHEHDGQSKGEHEEQSSEDQHHEGAHESLEAKGKAASHKQPKAEQRSSDETHKGHVKTPKKEKDRRKEHEQAHRISRLRDPVLGPDFERNVEENRKRNMPRDTDHNSMGHEHNPQ